MNIQCIFASYIYIDTNPVCFRYFVLDTTDMLAMCKVPALDLLDRWWQGEWELEAMGGVGTKVEPLDSKHYSVSATE